MKNNYSFDFIVIDDTLVNTSKSFRNTLKQPSQQASLSIKNIEIGDSLSKESPLEISSDSILQNSNLLINDTIPNADTIQQIVVQQEPRYGGKNISRFQNIGFGNEWFVAVILFSLLLLASVKVLFGKYLPKLVESIFNSHTANNLFIEKNINMIKGSAIINLLFIVNISLFAVNILNHITQTISLKNGFNEFVIIFMIILSLYIVKIVIISILAYVFKGVNESKEYLFTIFLYNKNLGLFLFPVIIALPFVQPYAVKWLMFIGVFMVFFFFLLRIVRGLKILFRKHVSIFYMILYLCALEIVPLLMIYKLLVR